MKINYPTLAVLSVLVLFAGLIVAQPVLAQGQEKASIVEGELSKVDPAAKTLSVKTPKGDMEFRYNEQTQISGAEGGVEGLATQSGAQVKVHFDAASKTATKIEVAAKRKVVARNRTRCCVGPDAWATGPFCFQFTLLLCVRAKFQCLFLTRERRRQ